jgi:hypothetical protein
MKTWQDGVNDYYKLKRDYENSINKDVKKIDKNMSIAEKRKEFKKLKPKCIDCNRPVGTIFSSKYDEEKEGRILTAVCGDMVNPCNLNISIFCGYIETYPEMITKIENEIKQIKNEIIVDKNNILFGFANSDEITEKFDKYKELVEEKTKKLTTIMELYNNEVDNKEINETIIRLQEEVYITIGYIKDAIKSYDNTNNTEFVNDSVRIFVNDLSPKLSQLMRLKYNYITVECENGVWTLVQKKTNVEQLEFSYNDSAVQHFEYKTVNYSRKSSSKSQTAKTANETISRNKTAKRKPGLTIEEDSGEDVSDYESIEKPKFTIEEDGSIAWVDPEYNKMWNRLSKKLRLALIENPVWMEHSMDTYVNIKKHNISAPVNKTKDYVFVEPPNLIIPPNELADGTFDFGNEMYNDLYNDPNNSVYKTLDGNMLRDAMNNAIAKKLDFNKNL